MGWSSGTRLFGEVIAVIKHEVPDNVRRKSIYLGLIPAFENADWEL